MFKAQSSFQMVAPFKLQTELAVRNEVAPPGTRKQQLARQRQKLEETLELLQRVTRERDQLWQDLCRTGDLADHALARAEQAQGRTLELETLLSQKELRIRELEEENSALLEQSFTLAERLELAEVRWRLLANND